MSLDMHDVTGQPQPAEEIREARDALKREVVTNALAMLKDGTPAVMAYMTAIRALDELLMVRAVIEKARRSSEPGGDRP